MSEETVTDAQEWDNLFEETDPNEAPDPSKSHETNQKFMDVKEREKANADLEVKVYEKIKEIFDPEIPVNIYELGLIYDVSITEQNEVVVLMTLTAPNCPEAGGIPMEVERKVKELDEVKDSKALLTFDPPWDMSMMSEEAKFELGML
jgi:FeS assembly SUF system protein